VSARATVYLTSRLYAEGFFNLSADTTVHMVVTIDRQWLTAVQDIDRKLTEPLAGRETSDDTLVRADRRDDGMSGACAICACTCTRVYAYTCAHVRDITSARASQPQFL
jgi:hypothetical protein